MQCMTPPTPQWYIVMPLVSECLVHFSRWRFDTRSWLISECTSTSCMHHYYWSTLQGDTLTLLSQGSGEEMDHKCSKDHRIICGEMGPIRAHSLLVWHDTTQGIASIEAARAFTLVIALLISDWLNTVILSSATTGSDNVQCCGNISSPTTWSLMNQTHRHDL